MANTRKSATKAKATKAKSGGAKAARRRPAMARKRKVAAKPQVAAVARGKSRTKAEGVIGRIPVAAPAGAMKALIRDKVLGKLAWNEGLGWYHGTIKFRGGAVDLCLVVEDKPELLEELLGRSRGVISRLHVLAHKAEDVAQAKIRELESARIGGAEIAPPSSPAMKFKRYMRLKAVEIDAGGRVSFLHDDGNVFWGHLIETTMTADEQVGEAKLAA